jgi:hypothetical protein
MVLSVALRKARAKSIKLWGERHSRATTAAVDQGFGPIDHTVIFALGILGEKRAKEEASWGLPGGANSVVFTPMHNPNKVRWGYLKIAPARFERRRAPLQFWHSYEFDLLAADGNSATFPLCTHEADLPQGPALPPGVASAPLRREEGYLVADDAAFFALDHKAHELLISVLPAALRAPLHADASELDTLVPPEGAWAPTEAYLGWSAPTLNPKPPATNHYPQTTNHKTQNTDHRPQTTDHRPRTTNHKSHTAK